MESQNVIEQFKAVKKCRKQCGGTKNVPNGGCLPIIKCNPQDIIKEKNKNRQFMNPPLKMSLSDILSKRRTQLL